MECRSRAVLVARLAAQSDAATGHRGGGRGGGEVPVDMLWLQEPARHQDGIGRQLQVESAGPDRTGPERDVIGRRSVGMEFGGFHRFP